MYSPEMPPPPAPGKPVRPTTMTWAVNLMYAGAIYTLLLLLLELLTLDREDMRNVILKGDPTLSASEMDTAINIAYFTGVGAAVFIALITAGLWVVMAIFNAKGMNWARITSTVLAGLSLISVTVSALVNTETNTFLSLTTGVIGLLLGITIVVLLWKPQSSQFYEDSEVARSRS